MVIAKNYILVIDDHEEKEALFLTKSIVKVMQSLTYLIYSAIEPLAHSLKINR